MDGKAELFELKLMKNNNEPKFGYFYLFVINITKHFFYNVDFHIKLKSYVHNL